MREADRFWAKVALALDGSGCLNWLGSRKRSGHGLFRIGGRNVYAHRWAWEEWNDPIPEGLVIDHLCRNPSCVNPDHLEVVTQRENVLRGMAPAAHNARKRTCDRGHEFVKRDGRRRCPRCDREAKRRYKRQRVLTDPVSVCQARDCVEPIPVGSRVTRRFCRDACRIRAWRAAA